MPSTYVPTFDLASAFPTLERRLCVRLHPRRGPSDAYSSKIGGTMAWRSTLDWPVCPEHGGPLIPVLQIRRSDVPELPFPVGTDVFQLLWCPLDHACTGYTPLPHVLWHRGSDLDVTSPSIVPSNAAPEYLPSECNLYPERVAEFPSAFALDDSLLQQLESWLADNAAADLRALGIELKDPEVSANYQYHFSVAPGTKVGGHVRWVQDEQTPSCSCGQRMDHLLTIDSAEFDGSYQRWLPIDDRNVWHTPPDVRKLVQKAVGITIGDAGSMFFFYCSSCGPGDVTAISQCS